MINQELLILRLNKTNYIIYLLFLEFFIKITGSVLSVAIDGKLAFRQGEKMVQIVEEIGKQLSDTSDNANIWWAHRCGLKMLH